MSLNTHYDVLIIGGGPVGMSLASALADLPLSVGLVEAAAPKVAPSFNYDGRAIALARGSQLFFERVGLWSLLEPFASPILEVHVSDRGHFGSARFTAEQMQVPALGFVVEMHQLLWGLQQSLGQIANLTPISPAKVVGLSQQQKHWQLTIESSQALPEQLTADLVIAADGANSSIRHLLQLEAEQKSYQQTAVVTNLGLSRCHQHVAYERFSDQGPLALLPMSEQRSALVWTVPTAEAPELVAMPEKNFLQHIQQRFGYRLGRFVSVGKRASFPLHRLQAKQTVLPGLVFIGNAAHTLHPIAAQGFNLGLRDVIALSQCIQQAVANKQSLNDISLEQSYEPGRRRDQFRTGSFTDFLAHVFNPNWGPLTLARNLGLVCFDRVPVCNRLLGQLTMGLL